MAAHDSLMTTPLADLWQVHRALVTSRWRAIQAGVPEAEGTAFMQQLLTAALLRRLEVCEVERLDG